jgi:hypothetical protein
MDGWMDEQRTMSRYDCEGKQKNSQIQRGLLCHFNTIRTLCLNYIETAQSEWDGKSNGSVY